MDVRPLVARDGHGFRAYTTGPQDAPRGLVVVQEIFGLNSHIREVCNGFAAAGFRVLSPALFDRIEASGSYGIELDYTSEDIEQGRTLAKKVGYFEHPLLEIEACIQAFPADLPVGVVGYCWGGTLAWLAACRLHPSHRPATGGRLAACVGYYGGMIGGLLDEPPDVPIMLHFGERDAHIALTEVEKIRTAYPQLPLYTYPAGHGFNCSARKDYDAAAAELARKRTLEFFDRHLT